MITLRISLCPVDLLLAKWVRGQTAGGKRGLLINFALAATSTLILGSFYIIFPRVLHSKYSTGTHLSQLMLCSHRNQAQIVLQNMPTENTLMRHLSLISLRERGSYLTCFVFIGVCALWRHCNISSHI